MKTKQITIDAMMAAMCAVLGYLAIDLGNLKITFESLPILVAALLFGPVDGMIVGGLGTLVYQLLRYGVSATTVLWILPYILCGLIVGIYAKRKAYDPSRKGIMMIVIIAEVMIFILNTFVIYADSVIYGYYSAPYVFGSIGIRFVICIVKSIVFGAILPDILKAVRKIAYK